MTVLVATSERVLRVAGLVQRFGGRAEPPEESGATIVTWHGAKTVESPLRMAEAMHAELAESEDSARIGVVAVSDASDPSRGTAQARRWAQALSTIAPARTTLVCAEPQTFPSSITCTTYGSLHPDPSGDPVSIAQVVSIAPAAEPARPRTVGRTAELSEFRERLAGVVDSGRGVVVHLQGAAGMGKTHLLGEIRQIALDHGLSCHRASNLQHGTGRARSASAILVRSLLGSPGSTPDADESSIARAGEDGRLSEDDAPFMRDLLELPLGRDDRALFDAMGPAVQQARVTAAVQSLVRAMAAERPLLLELEDMHWATPECSRITCAIAAQVADAPIVLALTSRPDDNPIDERWLEQAGVPPIVRWNLGRLSVVDAQALATAVLARRRTPWMLSTSQYIRADVVRRCAERCGGHPLLLEQMLLEQGGGVDLEAPASMSALVGTRLATLDPEDQRLVQVAAACGIQFDRSVVAAAMARNRWEVAPAVAAGLLLVDESGCRFTHGLVRDAVYEGIPDDERRLLHRRLADVLEAPALRAEHLELAGDERAAPAYLEAARAEDAAGRCSLALTHVERGLAAARDDAVRLHLLALAGRIYVDLGQPEPALAAFVHAKDLARSPADRCRALLGEVSALRLQSRLEDAEPLLAEAESLAAQRGLDEQLGLTAFYRGCLLFARGDVTGCMAQHERAVHYAREAGQPRTEALALSGLGDAYYASSRFRGALDVLERCIDLARTHGFGRIEVGNLFMRGALRALNHDLDAGLRDCLEAAQMAARVENRRAEMLATLNVGICSTVRGDTEAALRHIATANRLAEQMETRVFEGTSWAFEARALILAGDRAAGRQRAIESLALARDGRMRFFGGVALGALARATDAADERSEALAEAELLLAEPCPSHNYFYFYEDAIEVCLKARQWDRVEHFAAALDRVDEHEPIARCRVLAERARVLARLGRDPGDEAAMEAAAELLARVRAVGLRPLVPRLQRALDPSGGAAR